MKSHVRLTYGLLVLLALTMGWYFLMEKKILPERQKHEEDAKTLVDIKEENVGIIILTKNTPPKAVMTFEKTKDSWQLTTPVLDEANKMNVEALLSGITSMKQERILDDKPKDLALYGLKDPSLTVVLESKDKKQKVELKMGSDTPVGYSSYVQIVGKDTVYRVAKSAKVACDKDIDSFRNKAVVSLVRTEISGLTFEPQGKPVVQLERTPKDQWLVLGASEKLKYPGLADKINPIVSSVLGMEAKHFVDKVTGETRLKSFGLSPSTLSVVLTREKDKSKLTLLLGKTKDNKAYAKRSDKDVIYEIDPSILTRMQGSLSEFVDKNLCTFNRFDIKNLSIEKKSEESKGSGLAAIHVRKNNGTWEFVAPVQTAASKDPTTKVNQLQIDHLFTALQDIKLLDYAHSEQQREEADRQLKNAVLRIKLGEGDEKASEGKGVSLSFAPGVTDKSVPGGGKTGSVWVKRGQDVPFLVHLKDFAALNFPLEKFVALADTKAVKGDAKKSEPSVAPTSSKVPVIPPKKG